MAMGRWDGRTAEEIRGSEPAAFADWMARVGEFPFPEGESVPDLPARAWPAFEAIIGAHAGESVAIVAHGGTNRARSEEHTSELQSRENLVCRLLLEKKKKNRIHPNRKEIHDSDRHTHNKRTQQ